MNFADKKLAIKSETISPNDINEILNLYLLAIENMDESYNLAKAHKKTAEIYEQIGEVNMAIIHYEQALKYNPKMGIKTRLNNLKSENKNIATLSK